MSIIVFGLTHLIPGDPVHVMLGDEYTPQSAEQLRREMGLDRPLGVQYFWWLSRVLRGDLGQSLHTKQSVLSTIGQRATMTLSLAVGTLLCSVLLAVPLGVVSATRKDSLLDNMSRLFSMLGISMPVFWVGLLLMVLLSVQLGWLPPGGSPREFGWKALVMPSLTLALANTALVARMTRAMMLEVLRQDYVRTAHAKGLRLSTVHYKHALRNAIIPVVTVVGLQFGFLLGGAVLTEYIFSLPGLGSLLIDSIHRRDYPLIQGAVLLTGLMFGSSGKTGVDGVGEARYSPVSLRT
jgi:peptide/nickel transport system permease protein